MNKQSQLRNWCTAQSDQLWASLNRHLKEIRRIADHGPDDSELDHHLVAMVFHTVSAELLTRAYDLKHTEEPKT